MASDADIISHSEDTTLGLTPYGRTVKSVRRWPAVPVADLLRLRHVVDRRVETDRSAAAQERLHLVDAELTRRSASTEGIVPPVPRSSCEDPYPEAG
jgi:hypothetical protein